MTRTSARRTVQRIPRIVRLFNLHMPWLINFGALKDLPLPAEPNSPLSQAPSFFGDSHSIANSGCARSTDISATVPEMTFEDHNSSAECLARYRIPSTNCACIFKLCMHWLIFLWHKKTCHFLQSPSLPLPQQNLLTSHASETPDAPPQT